MRPIKKKDASSIGTLRGAHFPRVREHYLHGRLLRVVDAAAHDAETTVAFQLHGSDKAIEQWPERTDALCWHCRHGFEGVPASIPMACEDGVWQMKDLLLVELREGFSWTRTRSTSRRCCSR